MLDAKFACTPFAHFASMSFGLLHSTFGSKNDWRRAARSMQLFLVTPRVLFHARQLNSAVSLGVPKWTFAAFN